MEKTLPPIPVKRYFTIGEVSDLCGVKPYVLRYWEQEFSQLRPMKRRGNRRYYQHHEVLLIRRIRELLYDEGFTINGARNRLAEPTPAKEWCPPPDPGPTRDPCSKGPDFDPFDFASAGAFISSENSSAPLQPSLSSLAQVHTTSPDISPPPPEVESPMTWSRIREELMSIRALLSLVDVSQKSGL